MTDDTRLEAGRRQRRAVLGDAHVDRSEGGATDFDRDFVEYITEAAWGSVWTRPQIPLRERSMITIALLAALGHHEELALHTRATVRTGATPEDLREVIMHVAVYGGVPAAISALRVIRKALEEEGALPGKGAAG